MEKREHGFNRERYESIYGKMRVADLGNSTDSGGLQRRFDGDLDFDYHHHSDGIQQRAGHGCKRHLDGHRFALRGYRNDHVL